MAIPNMFRRALNLIPFVASTAKNGFTRVLSFTGSFNDRTSLLLAAVPGPVPEEQLQDPTPPSPSQSQEAPAAPATSVGPLDIEAAIPETFAGDGSGGGQGEETTAQDAEAKRVAKTVQTVCLFAASASLVLFVNLPGKPGGVEAAVDEAEKHAGGAVLYIVDMAFISLGLFTSLCLSMYSIVAKSGADDPAVARVQKRAMVMAVAFVLVSFSLRMCMMIPPRLLEWAWLVFVLLAGTVAVYLVLAWKLGSGQQRGAGEVPNGSVAGSSTVDQV